MAKEILDRERAAVLRIVRETYLAHHASGSVNPDSYFLRFPPKPDPRIIALPAFLAAMYTLPGSTGYRAFAQRQSRGATSFRCHDPQ